MKDIIVREQGAISLMRCYLGLIAHWKNLCFDNEMWIYYDPAESLTRA